jgi:hypothetical protein
MWGGSWVLLYLFGNPEGELPNAFLDCTEDRTTVKVFLQYRYHFNFIPTSVGENKIKALSLMNSGHKIPPNVAENPSGILCIVLDCSS